MMAALLNEIYFLILFIVISAYKPVEHDPSYVTLIPGFVNEVTAYGNRESFQIYCYGGENKVLPNIWRTLQVRIKAAKKDYELFKGDDASHVQDQFQQAANSYFNLLPWVTETIRLPAFNKSCFGISAHGSFSVRLDIIRIDYWKVLALLCGLCLFFMAPSFSKSVFFYYSSGVLLGVLASLLIIIFILSRYIPKKTVAAGALLAGWGLVLYFAQILWSQFYSVIHLYKNLVLSYFLVSGLISFAVCYRYGPVTDIRTMNLIKWTLQAVGLALVFVSTEWQEIGVTLIVFILAIYHFPAAWSSKLRTQCEDRENRPPVYQSMRMTSERRSQVADKSWNNSSTRRKSTTQRWGNGY